MKTFGSFAALCFLASTIWAAGCGGGTPNCDAYVTAAKACCDKATDATLKSTCNTQMDVLAKALSDAATKAGTDCADNVASLLVCPY